MNKRHAKPTPRSLAERTYRKVLAFHAMLLSQMALIRLDIARERELDRAILRVVTDHCARLLREKETLQRQLAIEIATSYTVTEHQVTDETDYSKIPTLMPGEPS